MLSDVQITIENKEQIQETEWSVLRETFSVMRDFPRLHEIASVLIRYGWGDVVRALGISALLERAGKLLHWHRSREAEELELPVRIRLALTELGPTFVKLGQILATRVDVFPPNWIAEFEHLHNQVPPVPFELLQSELESTWGKPISELFLAFDREPFASGEASEQVENIQRGDVSQMSFGFRVVQENRVVETGELDLREITELQLIEISPVTFPAYQDTEIQARAADVVARWMSEECVGESRTTPEPEASALHSVEPDGACERTNRRATRGVMLKNLE
jgi:ubiquinone biosynthesis protein